MDIDKLIDSVIGREGGYSNHPADKGGPTNFGVTEQVARAFGYKGDMRTLPRATAAAIYKARYWTGPKFDLVAAICPAIGHEMFDTGINMGVAIPGRFLQRALNAFNEGETTYPDIGVDGNIGLMTLAALRGFMKRRGVAGGEVLRKALDCQQGDRYLDITEGRKANEAFTYGWFANRIGELA